MSRFSFILIVRTVLLSLVLALVTVPATAQDLLEQWKERQQRIKRVIEDVGPCVVAIEGGCGVIVSQQGHVLSVSHVTRKANRRVQVKLADGTIAMGTTLGSDKRLDLGLLKLDHDREWPYVDVSGLPIPMPKSDEYVQPKRNLTAARVTATKRPFPSALALPETGDWCLAFGYPLSFERGRPAVVRLGKILSTDLKRIASSAVIMGGDSGGALVDLDGRLIGIGSRVTTSIDGNLYVPIQAYRSRWQQLLAGIDTVQEKQKEPIVKALPSPWLGVFGDTDESRVRVRQVQLGSPADAAGLKPEDVIVSFNKTMVSSFPEVVKLLKGLSPGDTVSIRVNRYGRFIDLSANLRSKR